MYIYINIYFFPKSTFLVAWTNFFQHPLDHHFPSSRLHGFSGPWMKCLLIWIRRHRVPGRVFLFEKSGDPDVMMWIFVGIVVLKDVFFFKSIFGTLGVVCSSILTVKAYICPMCGWLKSPPSDFLFVLLETQKKLTGGPQVRQWVGWVQRLHTHLKFNVAPENGGWETILSYWEGNFSGANC